MSFKGTLSPIVLASSSPRRREILRGIRNSVEIISPTDREAPPRPGENPRAYVSRLSSEKAKTEGLNAPATLVLAADTVVVLDETPLGKPRTEDEARRMLAMLRGRTHRVMTGVAIRQVATGAALTEVKETAVEMRGYSAGEIDRYLETGAPMDKAGGYGVQDESFRPVSRVDGCYLNVVGLPLCTVVKLLREVGAVVALRQREEVPYIQMCQRCELHWCQEAHP